MSETLREAIEAAIRAADAAVPWAAKAPHEPFVSIVLGEKSWRSAPEEPLRGWGANFVKSLPTLGRTLVLQTEGIEPMAAKDATVVVTGLVLGEGTEGHDAIAWSRAGSVMRAEAWAELCAIVR